MPKGRPSDPNAYPLAPLVARLGVPATAHGGQVEWERGPERALADRIAAWFGVPDDTARQWVVRRGRLGLTAEQADVLAISLGLHPSLVWTNWWNDVEGDDG